MTDLGGHSGRARNPGYRPGCALFRLVILILMVGSHPGAQAQPTDILLDFLHWNSHRQIALGGDPFLSPLAGQTGWWHQDLLEGGPGLRLENLQFLPVTPRLTAGEGRLETVSSRLGGGWLAEVRGRRLKVGVALESLRGSLGVTGDLASLRLEESGRVLTGLARIENVVPGLDLQVAAPLARGHTRLSGNELALGFRFNLLNRLWIGAQRERWGTGLRAVADLDQETVNAPLNLRSESVVLRGRVDLPLHFSLAAMVAESDHTPRKEFSDQGEDFQPQAWSQFRRQSLTWGREGRLGLVLRRGDGSLKAAGAGYWEGQRYLRLSHTTGELESYLLGLQLRLNGGGRLLVDFETGDFSAFVRVDVDSWRFAAWQEAWLGAKKVIQIEGEGRWERYHLGYTAPPGTWNWQVGLNHYELFPDAFSESWIHVPLVRPQDYERNDFARHRMSLGALSCGVAHELGFGEFFVKVHQFVYAYEHGREEEEAPEPSPAPGDPSQPRGWYGGTFARFGLCCDF